jgi:hypothetical protein
MIDEDGGMIIDRILDWLVVDAGWGPLESVLHGAGNQGATEVAAGDTTTRELLVVGETAVVTTEQDESGVGVKGGWGPGPVTQGGRGPCVCRGRTGGNDELAHRYLITVL